MTAPEEGGELTVLVADDEPLARRRVVELLRPRDDVRVLGECATGREALAAVRDLAPDILFLDVQMPGLDGFEVLDRLRADELPAVIFSTAFDEYALSAFEVHAVDYLLKPYADDRLEEALLRAETHLRARRLGEVRERLRALLDGVAGGESGRLESSAAGAGYRERFAVPGRKGLTVVEVESVEWIEASGDYATLHVGEKSHLLRTTMTELEECLDPRRFMRIHRSAIVRLDQVRQLLTDPHGDYLAVLERGVHLRVGRTYRNAVLRRLGRRP